MSIISEIKLKKIAGQKKPGASSGPSWKESPLVFLRIDLPSLDLT